MLIAFCKLHFPSKLTETEKLLVTDRLYVLQFDVNVLASRARE